MKINGEHHFNPTPKNVDRILDNYDLSHEDFEAAKSGIENTTLFVTTSFGRYVLRIYRQFKKADDVIDNEIAFMDYLRGRSIPVPRVIPGSDGGQLTHTTIDGVIWQAILMELLDGHSASVYTKQLVDNMADLQVHLHELSEMYPVSENVPRPLTLHEQPFLGLVEREHLPDQRMLPFLERTQHYGVSLPKEFRHGLCHLDLDKGNLLIDDRQKIAGVLDFDDMEDAPFVMDLAYAMWAVRCFGSDSYARRYQERYESARPLTDLEASFLPIIMLFRHYVVGSMLIANGECDQLTFERFLAIERTLLREIAAR